jgi:hypothetical protein
MGLHRDRGAGWRLTTQSVCGFTRPILVVSPGETKNMGKKSEDVSCWIRCASASAKEPSGTATRIQTGSGETPAWSSKAARRSSSSRVV